MPQPFDARDARALRESFEESCRLLGRELAEVRRRGFARTSEEMSLGAASVAVPVTVERLSGPVVVAALGIVVPAHRRDVARLAPVLQVAARGIGRALARTEQFR